MIVAHLVGQVKRTGLTYPLSPWMITALHSVH